ncbi:MAG TPA: DUF1552 domain-containing protein [Polyangiaceae bacterium]|nr:DUF1552 domain-containing protein [Polyangiaceae bacterium]
MALSRRTLLKGLGLGAVSYLPFARHVSSRAQGAPGNFLVFYSPNAWRRQFWGASQSGTTMTMAPSLTALEPHKADITVIRGLCLKSTTPIATHQDIVRILTCTGEGADGSEPGGEEQAYGPSIDHHITTQLGLPPPLTLAPAEELMLMADETNWMWRLSWRKDGDTVSHDLPKRDPVQVYSSLFAGLMPSGQPAEVDFRVQRGQSVLDLVNQDLQAMRVGLNAQDRGHLDVYEGSIREMERRLMQPIVACDPGMAPSASYLGTGDEVDKLQANGDVLMDLIGQSFACGIQRVATLQWGEGALGVNPARTTRDHHWVTHYLGGGSGDTDYDADGDIDVEDSQQLCDRWYADRFASCLTKFKELGILDDTVIVWCSETSEGHNQNDSHWIVAGGRNLGIQLGKVIEYPFEGNEGALMEARNTARRPENTSMADLWVSVQNAMGVPLDSFGEPGMTTGGLKDLYPGT